MRFCDDYRKLNIIAEIDVYSLPKLDECIDSLGDAVVVKPVPSNTVR
jgi:hypothetical protein